jgi:hypothetical protein
LKTEERPKFKLNLKVALLIILSIVGIISFLLLIKSQESTKKLLTPFQPISGEKKEKTNLEFVVSFGYVANNNPVYILFNRGNMNITNFSILVDGIIKDYKIVSGSLPLEQYKSLYFEITGLCDNETHLIEVIVENIRKNVTLKDECKIGSRL